MSTPSEELKAGRRALDGVRGIELLRDVTWDPGSKRFFLRIRIEIEPVRANAQVPARTDWYVWVDPAYPFGSIKVYPAKRGGIDRTFPHQSRNDARRGAPFRSGDLCLASPLRSSVGARLSPVEPLEPHRRLTWHVRRARTWLEAATRGALLPTGDHYELPAFPGASSSAERPTLVFAEGADDIASFRDVGVAYGLAALAELESSAERRVVVMEWADREGLIFARPRWGRVILEAPKKLLAAWILLPAAPVLPPWQAPATWGELRRAVASHGASLDRLLQPVVTRLRKEGPFLLLVGFPIPARVGEPARELHWQPIEVPSLMPTQTRSRRGKARSFHHGFRDNALGRWQYARQGPLADKRRLAWRSSENWHSDRIGARGRLALEVRSARIVIIGVGALGSHVADLLVRMGVRDLLLIDGDTLAVGNLSRHRLGIDALGEPKASALAEALNLASPHACVRADDRGLPWDEREARKLLEGRDIVLDLTGEDAVLAALGARLMDATRLFVSISIGLSGRRLYFYSARAVAFPFDDFRARLRPWLDDSMGRSTDQDFVWEGAGCWHPLSPTRCDDVSLLGAVATKLLEGAATSRKCFPRLQVFERGDDEMGGFGGLTRVDAPEPRS
ncbi:HesA/MoeB/ThiF family protein [Polyangium mundeleinium]|uniref:ThiF family adenylyltransferase n=1 Tax=Polyangium mundeleinium TaxID=2995306 RepID=A0ABT5EUE8_9BACT|nr:ThiF family adenylyltransferase [Polyangium mundeleinium]MDC0744813.1 ThiF family adenylyltransferase [Polyangium mundeleinium]